MPESRIFERLSDNFSLLVQPQESLFDREFLLELQEELGEAKIPMAHIKFPISRVDAMVPRGGLTSRMFMEVLCLKGPIMARIAVTDGMAKAAISVLEKAGHEVVVGHIEKEDLLIWCTERF